MIVVDLTDRRTFLKGMAAAGLGAVTAGMTGCASTGRRWEIEPVTAPSREKVRVAFIATGGIGGYHLKATEEMDVVCPCYCDVDTNRMGRARERYPNARAYQDYRDLFDKEHKNFDAVMIGTPDHHHYPATMIAMQLGKHVYTQKPLTHTPWEARQLTKAAAKYKVATQMGNQGHALEGWRLVYEWINSGALGDVYEVHSWTDRPIWPQGMGRPEKEDTPPPNLDWDVWLGPAPQRPYVAGPAADKPGPYHWFNWRGWWDFGAGALGDMACHTMDGVFWALNPGHCTAIEPLAMTNATTESFPDAAIVKWEFPGRGLKRGFDCYWYDGGLRPTVPEALEWGRSLPNTGNLFLGTKNSLMVAGDYGESPRIIPELKMREVGKPDKMLERSPGHVAEWLMACKGEKPITFPKSNFSYAGPFSETVLLGNVALRVGRRIEWDGDHMEVTNVPEANAFVSKEYREGWRVTPPLDGAVAGTPSAPAATS